MTDAEILAIGDELVHGQGLDTNSRHLALELEAAGLAVRRFTVVSDEPDDLARALRETCQRADVVVATGGLGPTLDDRTREVAAALAGVPLRFDEASWQHIQEMFQRRGRQLPESNRRQAHLPEGADVLANPVGTAPGFRMKLGEAVFFALPGVPWEMERMLREHVMPWLLDNVPGCRPVASHWLRILGPSEALLGERIAGFMTPGREPRVGITAHYGMMTVRIVGSGDSAAEARAACAETAADIRPRVAEWLFYEGEEEPQEAVGRSLLAAGLPFATAESCTGGLVAAALTDVAGISEVFVDGFVTYSDAAKTRDLGVDGALLAEHGAVSEPVAAAMAAGAAERAGARLAVSVTGIAGPGGGSADKPVGTVCFGLWHEGDGRAWTVRIPDISRRFVRERAVLEALAALHRVARDSRG